MPRISHLLASLLLVGAATSGCDSADEADQTYGLTQQDLEAVEDNPACPAIAIPTGRTITNSVDQFACRGFRHFAVRSLETDVIRVHVETTRPSSFYVEFDPVGDGARTEVVEIERDSVYSTGSQNYASSTWTGVFRVTPGLYEFEIQAARNPDGTPNENLNLRARLDRGVR